MQRRANGRPRLKSFPRRAARVLESLESRLLLDASGFAGNACPPDLTIETASRFVLQNESIEIDLSEFTVQDLDANDNPTGDTIRFQLDPDDGPQNATINDGVFSWSPTADQTGTFEFVLIAIDSGSPALADAETFEISVVNDEGPDLASIADTSGAVVNEEIVIPLSATDADGDTINFNIDPDNVADGFTITNQQNSNGSATAELRFTPTAAMVGEARSVTVLATSTLGDGTDPALANSDAETFTLTVSSVLAADDDYQAVAGTPLEVDVAGGLLANDSDVSAVGMTLTVSLEDARADIPLALQADGSFTYTAEDAFSGTETFRYRVQNSNGDEAVGTVTIEVAEMPDDPPTNEAPVTIQDTYLTNEGVALEVAIDRSVLANDSDPNGDTLTAQVTSPAGNGQVTLNSDGTFTYTPNAGFSGTDTFRYVASDGELISESTVVAILVQDVNTAPIGVADSFETTNELNVSAAEGVLANDTDDGDSITASVLTEPANGELSLASDGSFSYTPDASFFGTDSFTYQANDGTSDSEATTVTILVLDPNALTVSTTASTGDVVGTVAPVGNFNASTLYQIDDDSVPDLLKLNADDHIAGDADSEVVLIEYYDFQCPACQAIHPTVHEFEDTFEGDLLVVRRHLPLESIHLNAREAGQSAEAAARQGSFDDYGDILFERQGDWAQLGDPTSVFEGYATELGLDLAQFRLDVADAAIDAGITSDANDAIALGANSTPTFFLQGERFTVQSVSGFEASIQAAVDDFDDLFLIDRLTGEITVADEDRLAAATLPITLPVLVRDTNGNEETVDVSIDFDSV